MGKIVEEKKKKKKGRPSLLDLQKRSLKEQQEKTQKPNPNPNPNPYSNPHFKNPSISNPNRRFNLRNPNSDGITAAEEEEVEEEEDSSEKRKEKKLKLVLRLPSQQPVNSTSLNSSSYVSDSNAEDDNGETQLKKRKINVVGDRSGVRDVEKEEKQDSASKTTATLSGTQIEAVPTTPLPDKKLMVFILDRLQKKDTYGVYSEPVDPKELPDYHEIIEHPMDFGTVRKKLLSGAYANLEQFEKDVLLICSNAMRYNAPDTIYFRQARSIQELAKRDFDNLRQVSDDENPRPKIVRRGRPPTKNLKKNLGRPSLERAGSEFSSDATLATGGDSSVWSNSYDLRKGLNLEKSGSAEALGRASHRSRQGGAYASWLTEHKSDGNDEFPASVLKGTSMKFGKKNFVLDENRRNTYKQSLSSVGGREASVLTTFDGERKQLMAVGLHMEYSFARSLARFAATLGPVAWKIASKKIERALPAGMKFGPGWVGEHEKSENPVPQRPQMPSPAQSYLPQQHSSLPIMSSSTATSTVDPKADKSLVEREPSDDTPSNHSNKVISTTTVVSLPPLAANISPEPAQEHAGTSQVLNYQGVLSSSDNGGPAIRPYPPFQIHQTPLLKNGFSGGFGFNLASQSQTGKPVRPVTPVGAFGSEPSMNGTISRSNNNSTQSIPPNHSELEDTKLPRTASTINSGTSVADSSHDSQAGPQTGQPSEQEEKLSQQQKIDSVPPDLNVRFQSPGSPSINPQQPDLVLQL